MSFHANCPRHSYRQLPIRIGEMPTTRYESSGTPKARPLAQIVCTPEQIKSEVANVRSLI